MAGPKWQENRLERCCKGDGELGLTSRQDVTSPFLPFDKNKIKTKLALSVETLIGGGHAIQSLALTSRGRWRVAQSLLSLF